MRRTLTLLVIAATNSMKNQRNPNSWPPGIWANTLGKATPAARSRLWARLTKTMAASSAMRVMAKAESRSCGRTQSLMAGKAAAQTSPWKK